MNEIKNSSKKLEFIAFFSNFYYKYNKNNKKKLHYNMFGIAGILSQVSIQQCIITMHNIGAYYLDFLCQLFKHVGSRLTRT